MLHKNLKFKNKLMDFFKILTLKNIYQSFIKVQEQPFMNSLNEVNFLLFFAPTIWFSEIDIF